MCIWLFSPPRIQFHHTLVCNPQTLETPMSHERKGFEKLPSGSLPLPSDWTTFKYDTSGQRDFYSFNFIPQIFLHPILVSNDRSITFIKFILAITHVLRVISAKIRFLALSLTLSSTC